MRSAAISPDGKFLAYSDHTGLYLKEIRTGETHRVPLPQNFSAEVTTGFRTDLICSSSTRNSPAN